MTERTAVATTTPSWFLAVWVSVMMPCPWVPGFVRYLKEHPSVDAGLHLTKLRAGRVQHFSD